MSKKLKADLALLALTLAWGSSYYMTDSALMETSPLALNAIRFLGAFFLAAIIGRKKMKNQIKY